MDILVKHVNQPTSRLNLVRKYCSDKDVLDIGCVNHNSGNTSNQHWMHQQICDVARSCIGIDLLSKEISILKSRGYNVICADVSQPIEIDNQFDVIVVGNLIEHLSNFDGLFANVLKLLKPDGHVLISSANPFYCEQYFYAAFKNDIVVNPEHTCWIDPVTLEQLVQRYELNTTEVYWIKEKWLLPQIICHGKTKRFDMLTGEWRMAGPATVFESVLRQFLYVCFRLFWPTKAKKALNKYKTKFTISGLLYVKFISSLFGLFWWTYGLIIVKSPINSHELYMSIIKRTGQMQE